MNEATVKQQSELMSEKILAEVGIILGWCFLDSQSTYQLVTKDE